MIKYLTLIFLIPGVASERCEISENVIRKAFSATEEGFLSLVNPEDHFLIFASDGL